MPVVYPAGAARPGFDLKSAQLPLVSLVLRDADMRRVLPALARHLAEDPDFFDGDPILIDLTQVVHSSTLPDFAALIQALRQRGARAVAARGGNRAQMQAAVEAGLLAAPHSLPPQPPAVREVEVVREVVREVPAARAQAMLVEKPLRAGQSVHARGTDLVLLAAVNPGAEVFADGNIHVYAPLRGKAVAGAGGCTTARIFSTCMQAQMLGIAGIYHSGEFADDIAARPAQAWLAGEEIVLQPL